MLALGPDPYRAQLDERWRSYLRTRTADADHSEWMSHALADYRDEIVHFGVQLLNDVAIRPWDSRAASGSFERYRTEAVAYDADPSEWERTFWNGVRDGLPLALRSRWVDPVSRGRADVDGR
ncbi:hypothetical protein [Curtobacterium luteum]|uniref:hypothetical protein n=1 Tax=Curtobacterium luteum TaxID=33881 RepID=UPI00382D5A48